MRRLQQENNKEWKIFFSKNIGVEYSLFPFTPRAMHMICTMDYLNRSAKKWYAADTRTNSVSNAQYST